MSQSGRSESRSEHEAGRHGEDEAARRPARPRPGTLLLCVPVPFFRRGDAWWYERQACNGLRLWTDEFERVVLASPFLPGEPPPGHVDMASLGAKRERVEVVPLPSAYHVGEFARTYRATRRRLGEVIDRADYLNFAIGGLIGDWASFACLEAARKGRPYAVWTDRVESLVTRRHASAGSLKSRARAALTYGPMAGLERRIVRQAALGLFHGRDTFEAYAPYSQNAHLVHDIHLPPDAAIGPDALEDKVRAVSSGPLRLVYAGRAAAMKGPLDWVDCLGRLKEAGVPFEASWIGDGELLEGMRARAEAQGLAGQVRFPGYVDDRAEIARALRRASAFVFCHQTPESPRVLIEALVEGTPIVGYRSAYAADLISGHGGGELVPLGDVEGLAAVLRKLGDDPSRRRDLVRRAAADGAAFNDEAVFAHRSELIAQHLSG